MYVENKKVILIEELEDKIKRTEVTFLEIVYKMSPEKLYELVINAKK